MTMGRGFGNFDAIGVQLAVLGQAEYERALQSAGLAARLFASSIRQTAGEIPTQIRTARLLREEIDRLNRSFRDAAATQLPQARTAAAFAGRPGVGPAATAASGGPAFASALQQQRAFFAETERLGKQLTAFDQSVLAQRQQFFAGMKQQAEEAARVTRQTAQEVQRLTPALERTLGSAARGRATALGQAGDLSRQRFFEGQAQSLGQFSGAAPPGMLGAAQRTAALATAQKEMEQATKASSKAIKEQQTAFSGLNPHMAASIFYTQQVGAGFITLRGAAGLAALGIASVIGELEKARDSAIAFEATVADVQKVANLSEPQLKLLSDGLKEMAANADATKGPVGFTVEQLAAIATEASRAGIEGAANLKDFTKAIADVATSSDIAAEEATRDYARIAFALQEPLSRIRNLTSAVTALDIALPTSTAEILKFSSRIAAAGNAVGLASEDVFAISAALSSLGVQSEAGGTAIQRTLFAIQKAVNDTSKKGQADLAKFAFLAQMSSAEFAETWRTKPGAAFAAFVRGLGDTGEDAAKALDAIGLSDVRLTRSLLVLGQNFEFLERATRISTEAIKDGNLTNERAQVVYRTTAAQIKAVEQAFENQRRTLGESLLPIYRQWLEFLTNNVLPFLTDNLPSALQFVGNAFDDMGTGIRLGVDNLRRPFADLGAMMADARLTNAKRQFELAQASGNTQRLERATNALAEAERQAADAHRTQASLLNAEAVAANQAARAFNQLITVQAQGREKAARKEIGQFTGLDSNQLQAEIGRIQEAVAGYRETLAELEATPGAGARRTGLAEEITKQSIALDLLQEQLAATVKQEALFRRETSDLDLPPIFDAGADRAEKAKTALQQLGVSADQARKFLLSLGIDAERSNVALLSLGADVDELGETVDGFGISTSQAASLMRAAGFSAEEIAAKINRIHFERLAKQLDELTKGIRGGLIPTLQIAVGIIGEDLVGAVRGAAVAVAGTLTDALLRQAAIVGGPYAQVWIDVAGILARAAQAGGEATASIDAQIGSAEAAAAALKQAGENLVAVAERGGDVSASIGLAQNSIDQLRVAFEKLPEAQRKVALELLAAAQALLDQARAAGDDATALAIINDGLITIIGTMDAYIKKSEEMTAADKKRADAAKTAEEKLAEAKSAEIRANENLTKQNDRLAAAQKALAEARASGDPAAIKAAQDELALARSAVQRAKERVRERREERKEAEVGAVEAKEGAAAAEAKEEELTEAEKKRKREERRLPPAERRKLAAFQAPTFIDGTIPLRAGSAIPGVSDIPLRPAALGGGNVDSSRSVTINANYQTQPEVTVRHDLEALSMMGLV